ncbi:MAG: ErfK/YbiS/YcfS/YnhG family protein [Candidatus Woesebacteria bacterium GW2011_GWA1_40_45]|uniref:ErfK/YbiS/YcfS/YnhG family protein n=1 Tax=Candidatus Woesebacteria bacterium GW2011_GWA1_40_45 TaxID=1618554 RepID=A0A0G0SDR8_9BACT|nr:MAG: ErfK/YbiS/YcfS/YnhG family protein [Candidatus Woesebacteria bacterium GW2011_GWA1_40_45]
MKRKNLPKLIFGLLLVFLAVSLGVFLISLRRGATTIACGTSDLSGNFDESELTAIFEDKKIAVPVIADSFQGRKVLGEAAPSSRWIEVDLSEQKLKAWDGGSLFLETPVSTGLPWWPTPPGEFRVWLKVRATKMEGGSGKYYYYLPNVPFVMFYENAQVPRWRGFSLHGTYWHIHE